ncbi:MAG: tRNA pseudouridine(13) synthase TruD [Caldilinea sp.]
MQTTDEIVTALPYLTATLPGIGGQLRAKPEDFVVEEIGLYEAAGAGQHLYVNLTKVGWTTKELQIQLSKIFGLERMEVGFAGLKDKMARTTQTFSLNVGQKPAAFAEEVARRIEAELPVQVNWVQFHRNKLRTGHLIGNRFTIKVSHLAINAEETRRRSDAIVAEIRRRGVPNFFGVQRTGLQGNNVRQGLALLLGKQKLRDVWLRRFLMGSYQSHLCNQYLIRRLEIGAFDQLLAGDVAKKVATGGMFDVQDLQAEQLRYAAHEINFTAPLYGPRMWNAQGEAGELEKQLLAAAPVTLEEFARHQLDGTRRAGRLLVPDLHVQVGEGELTATFVLTKGAFATVLLRELMKVDDETLSVVQEEDE